MQIHQTSGSAVPFFVDDFFLEDITTDAFDPITTLHDSEHVSPTEMTVQHAEGLYAKNGFLVRPNADGALYVITLRQLWNALSSKEQTIAQKAAVLATLEPKKFNGLAGVWVECPVIKVMGGDGDGSGHYESVPTEIEVGIIL